MQTSYLEVSALLESEWTGIGSVVAAITQKAYEDISIDWHFFYENMEIPRTLIGQMLRERSGRSGRQVIAETIWEMEPVNLAQARSCKAVFTNIKPVRNVFASEALVVYDLSPLLTPQFHNHDNINYFGNRFRSDVESSEHFFPISEATRGDIETYFGVPRSASTIIKLGVDIDPIDLSLAQEIARTSKVEPYVIVLGTLEPRKNGSLILDYIARNPGFGRRFRIVFMGRDGWLDERDRLVQLAEMAGVPRGQIIFTGYVSEREKIGLLYNASFCIYASFFEGFGLPILEAAALKKLVVCSKTSSMTEIAPSWCYFFDPSDIVEFSQAVSLAEKRAPQLRKAQALPEMIENVKQFGWNPCYFAIRSWVTT